MAKKPSRKQLLQEAELATQVVAARHQDRRNQGVARIQQRSGIAPLETWRRSVQDQHQRLCEQADDLEKRVRKQEEFTAGQKVYVAVAAVISRAVVSGCVGLILRLK